MANLNYNIILIDVGLREVKFSKVDIVVVV